MNHNHTIRLIAAGTITAVLTIGAACVATGAGSSETGRHQSTLTQAGKPVQTMRKEY